MAILEEEGVDIPNDDPFDANAQVNARLNSYVALWSDNDIEKVVGYMKEWNTNARYSYVSQCFISSLFTGVIIIAYSLTHSHTHILTLSLPVVKVEKLLKIRSVCEAVPALLSYTDRHYQRVDKLYQGSYLLEYMVLTHSLIHSLTHSFTHSLRHQ
jgi:U3 small nucleolar RNA-associated protein 13